MPTAARWGYLVAVLTDEDALENYRRTVGVPERGVEKFVEPRRLPAALESLPLQFMHLGFAPFRRMDWSVQEGRFCLDDHVNGQIATQHGRA